MKKNYLSPWMEVVTFTETDIVTVSDNDELEDETNPFLV